MPALSENGWFPDKFRVLDRLRYVFHLAGLFSTSEVIDLVTEYDLLTDAYADSETKVILSILWICLADATVCFLSALFVDVELIVKCKNFQCRYLKAYAILMLP